MGYCTYYTNPNGNAVATWVGTGTDAGKKKQVIFLKGSLGARSKTSACNEARSQFCKLYGIGGRCYDPGIQSQIPCSQNLIEKQITGNVLCADLTYPPDPNKGTSQHVVNPKGSTGGGSGSGAPSGADTRNCAQGNIMACFSEIGNSTGRFFTDAFKTGGEQGPLILLVGAAVVIALVLGRR